MFGSEIKSVLANPHVPRRLRTEAIAPCLTFGYVPTPDTFFEGVRSVPPGHVLVAEPGREPQIERHWSPPLAGIDGVGYLDISMEEEAREVRSLLEAAVRRRLISDVPLGAFLSGGIDSSAIVGMMASEIDLPVQTFTIGFEDTDGFDERPFAQLVAERPTKRITMSSSCTPMLWISWSTWRGTTTSRSGTRARSRPSCSARSRAAT